MVSDWHCLFLFVLKMGHVPPPVHFGNKWLQVPPPSPTLPQAYKIQVKYVLGVFEVKEFDYDFRMTWFPIGCPGIAPAFCTIVTPNLSSPPNRFKSSWA